MIIFPFGKGEFPCIEFIQTHDRDTQIFLQGLLVANTGPLRLLLVLLFLPSPLNILILQPIDLVIFSINYRYGKNEACLSSPTVSLSFPVLHFCYYS